MAAALSLSGASRSRTRRGRRRRSRSSRAFPDALRGLRHGVAPGRPAGALNAPGRALRSNSTTLGRACDRFACLWPIRSACDLRPEQLARCCARRPVVCLAVELRDPDVQAGGPARSRRHPLRAWLTFAGSAARSHCQLEPQQQRESRRVDELELAGSTAGDAKPDIRWPSPARRASCWTSSRSPAWPSSSASPTPQKTSPTSRSDLALQA
jgi:hypothetical protein